MVLHAWIPGFEGEYEVDSLGNIYSWKSGSRKPLKVSRSRASGHCSIILDRNKPRLYISRIVWNAFKGETLNKKEWIFHINGNPSDNSLQNLRKHVCKKLPTLLPPPDPETAKYKGIGEDGKNYYFNNIAEMCSAFGVEHQTIKKALKTGEYISITPKKNL